MSAIIYDICPYDCRLPVNLPNEFSAKNVKITIEIVEPSEVPAEKPVDVVPKDTAAKVK